MSEASLDDLVKLDDIAEDFLGMSADRARRRFGKGDLPIAAFRTGDPRRGPIYVHKDDLARHIDARRKAATTQANKMRPAGVTQE